MNILLSNLYLACVLRLVCLVLEKNQPYVNDQYVIERAQTITAYVKQYDDLSWQFQNTYLGQNQGQYRIERNHT